MHGHRNAARSHHLVDSYLSCDIRVFEVYTCARYVELETVPATLLLHRTCHRFVLTDSFLFELRQADYVPKHVFLIVSQQEETLL